MSYCQADGCVPCVCGPFDRHRVAFQVIRLSLRVPGKPDALYRLEIFTDANGTFRPVYRWAKASMAEMEASLKRTGIAIIR
jgi:hypothetical protein